MYDIIVKGFGLWGNTGSEHLVENEENTREILQLKEEINKKEGRRTS